MSLIIVSDVEFGRLLAFSLILFFLVENSICFYVTPFVYPVLVRSVG